MREGAGGGTLWSAKENLLFLEDSLLANSPTIFISISNIVY